MSNPRKLITFKVIKIKDHTPYIRELVLATSEEVPFNFQAGQFAMLHVPQPDKPALRAYSIASDERENFGFTLIFSYVDGGIASHFVWSLKGGETLQFTGPFGRLFFKDPPAPQIIFLNTGSGLAQHMSYLLSKKEQFPTLKYRMLLGLRTETDIYYLEQLKELHEELLDFEFEYVLSRPSSEWTGKRGYVQHFLNSFDYKSTLTHFYLCGNRGMIKEAKHQLIEVDGIDPHHIFAEAFD